MNDIESSNQHGVLGPTVSAVVSVRGLTKRYGDVVAVEGVTFALEPGTLPVGAEGWVHERFYAEVLAVLRR